MKLSQKNKLKEMVTKVAVSGGAYSIEVDGVLISVIKTPPSLLSKEAQITKDEWVDMVNEYHELDCASVIADTAESTYTAAKLKYLDREADVFTIVFPTFILILSSFDVQADKMLEPRD